MENDDSRAQRGQGDIQATASSGSLELLGEMLQICFWGIPKELEEVIMQPVCMSSIDDKVGDGQDLKQQPRSLA